VYDRMWRGAVFVWTSKYEEGGNNQRTHLSFSEEPFKFFWIVTVMSLQTCFTPYPPQSRFHLISVQVVPVYQGPKLVANIDRWSLFRCKILVRFFSLPTLLCHYRGCLYKFLSNSLFFRQLTLFIVLLIQTKKILLLLLR